MRQSLCGVVLGLSFSINPTISYSMEEPTIEEKVTKLCSLPSPDNLREYTNLNNGDELAFACGKHKGISYLFLSLVDLENNDFTFYDYNVDGLTSIDEYLLKQKGDSNSKFKLVGNHDFFLDNWYESGINYIYKEEFGKQDIEEKDLNLKIDPKPTLLPLSFNQKYS